MSKITYNKILKQQNIWLYIKDAEEKKKRDTLFST